MDDVTTSQYVEAQVPVVVAEEQVLTPGNGSARCLR